MDPRTRTLLLAGVPVPRVAVPARFEVRDLAEGEPDAEPDAEGVDEAGDVDEAGEGPDADEEPDEQDVDELDDELDDSVPVDEPAEDEPVGAAPLARHRMLEMLGVDLRAAPLRVPKGYEGGGRFRSATTALIRLLHSWDGTGDPLAGQSTAKLRDVAATLGLDPPAGMKPIPLRELIYARARAGNLPPVPDVPMAEKPLAALRKQVTDAGITIPAGAPRAVVENLVDALERGVAPARAREAAVRELTELRGMVGDKLAQTAAALENGASDRAMAYYARQLRRLSSGEGGLGYPSRAVPELGKPLQDLIAALERGDAAAAKAALPKAVTGSKLKALGEPGAIVARSKLGSDLEWVGAGRGDVVEVLHPGYSSTLEGRTVTVTKPSVRAATPEQAQAFRQPVKAAKKAAAPKATTPAAFDRQAAGAATGQEALTAPKFRMTDPTDTTVRPSRPTNPEARAVYDAVRSYRRGGSNRIGVLLRGGQIDASRVAVTREAIAGIDKAMVGSALDRDVVVWRGQPGGFGLDLSRRDLAGFQWTDPAFVGTSAKRAAAQSFAEGGDAVLMRVVAPRGTRAVQLSGMDTEAEILLDRGLTYRVVADHGVVDGKRLLDVEVVPKSAPTQAAAKAAPAKKAATPRVPKAPEPAKMSLPALRTELDKAMERAGATVDLASVPKQALADMVTRARTLPAAELKAEVGRWRQVVIDRRRDVADLLSQADQLLDAEATAAVLGQRGASIVRRWEQAAQGWPDLVEARKVVAAMQTGDPAKIRRAIAAARKKLGLEQIGADAGTVARYDAKAMTPIGGKIDDGAHVVVVRPGYRMADGTVLSKPVVEVASPEEVAAAGLTGKDRLDFLAYLRDHPGATVQQWRDQRTRR